MRAPTWLVPVGVTAGAFVGLFALSSSDRFLGSIGAQDAVKQWKVELNGLLSAAAGGLAALIKTWFKPVENTVKVPQEPHIHHRAAPDSAELHEAEGQLDWRREYQRALKAYNELRAKAIAAIRERDEDIKELRDDVASRTKLIEAARLQVEQNLERRAKVRFSLYCGMALAFASCVATLMYHPQKSSQGHLVALLIAYGAVAAVFSAVAVGFKGHPTKGIHFLMIGGVALYVNMCSLLIFVVYSFHEFFGLNARGMWGMQVGVIIGINRLIALPLVAAAGAFFGTLVGIGLKTVNSVDNKPT
jgi:hypothetical protein